MDWRDFFKLHVSKHDANGPRPYFHSTLNVPGKFDVEELVRDDFGSWRLTETEVKRLSLNLRKILHCHRYFNSLEFDRISGNFTEKLLAEKGTELRFATRGGGIYLFIALLKLQHQGLAHKSIICETSEIPLPIMKLPQENHLTIKFTYRPEGPSFLAGFPSLWAHPEVLKLFDPKASRTVA